MSASLLSKFFSWKSNKRAATVASFLLPHLKPDEKVLDFGAGNMRVAAAVHTFMPSLQIQGIDVLGDAVGTLPFKEYDGHSIPFPSATFDTLYAISVFHHVDNLNELFAECLRVTKHKLIIHEDVYTSWWDLFITKALDWTLNKLMSPNMHVPFNFKTEDEWLAYFKTYSRVKNIESYVVRPEAWRPTRHRLFVLDLGK